ncbi:unnamed protein product [Heterobilharzia americana]|nr:unnamed protein product [Heterobilharzia americana]CAH8611535.1 unnamed protein product [Heterobilharzia americana]
MTIYLRIKRSYSECPSNIYEAQNLIKRPKSDLQPIKFQYIGSQTTSKGSSVDKIDEVCESSDKLGKIICNTSDATVVDENDHSTKCQVKVNNLKRPASTNLFNQFSHLSCDSPEKPNGPRPPKVFKVIELTPESTVTTPLNCGNNKDVENSEADFVYDIYKMISNSYYPSESTIWCTENDVSNDNPFIKNMNNYICDDYDEVVYDNDDDEDDSNSESNWRNDYPDEKSSSSDSLSSKLSDSEVESDDDDDY